jgi:hypothetical protein
VAFISVLSILVILLAVVALIIVNALKDSPWGAFTIGMTIPIALLMGVYLRYLRPGRVLEASVLGFLLVVAAIFGGQWISQSTHAGAFTFAGTTLAILIIVYGFAASALPVWLLLAPRDYLSTFVKRHRRHPGAGDFPGAPHVADARAHALHRWQRARICRQSFSFRVHHHCVRGHQRISFVNFQRHHAQDDCPRTADAHRRLRRHDV